MTPQAQRLKKFFDMGLSITPLTAWTELGIYRLSARVYELRKAGVPVKRELVSVMSRFGDRASVAKYSL